MTTLEKIKLEITSHFLWDGEVKTDIPYTVQVCLDIIDKYAEQSGWEEMTVPCEHCGHDMTFKIATIGEPCENCKYKSMAEQEPRLWNNHQVACLLADMFDDACACNYNGIDEWLPDLCDFKDTCCPKPVGVACWEQFLKHSRARYCECGYEVR